MPLRSPPSQIHLFALPRRELAGGLTVLVADTRRARGRGLSRLDEMPRDHALALPGCRSVHTVGMRFALDLLWLDAAGTIVRLDRGVGPRRLCSCRRASTVVECRAGEGERFAEALLGAARTRDVPGARAGPSASRR